MMPFDMTEVRIPAPLLAPVLLCFIAVSCVNDVSAQVSPLGDEAGRFVQVAPPDKVPDRVYHPTEAAPSEAFDVDLDDLHGDEWDVQYNMGAGITVPNPQPQRTEEQMLREKAKLAHRMWRMQTGDVQSVESSEEPEADAMVLSWNLGSSSWSLVKSRASTLTAHPRFSKPQPWRNRRSWWMIRMWVSPSR